MIEDEFGLSMGQSDSSTRFEAQGIAGVVYAQCEAHRAEKFSDAHTVGLSALHRWHAAIQQCHLLAGRHVFANYESIV